MGSFLKRFTREDQFLFHEWKLLYHGIHYKKTPPPPFPPHPRWEVRQILKIAPFSVKPFITLTCRNCLINPVTDKFYYGILIRVANETVCESLTDQ